MELPNKVIPAELGDKLKSFLSNKEEGVKPEFVKLNDSAEDNDQVFLELSLSEAESRLEHIKNILALLGSNKASAPVISRELPALNKKLDELLELLGLIGIHGAFDSLSKLKSTVERTEDNWKSGSITDLSEFQRGFKLVGTKYATVTINPEELNYLDQGAGLMKGLKYVTLKPGKLASIVPIPAIFALQRNALSDRDKKALGKFGYEEFSYIYVVFKTLPVLVIDCKMLRKSNKEMDPETFAHATKEALNKQNPDKNIAIVTDLAFNLGDKFYVVPVANADQAAAMVKISENLQQYEYYVKS